MPCLYVRVCGARRARVTGIWLDSNGSFRFSDFLLTVLYVPTQPSAMPLSADADDVIGCRPIRPNQFQERRGKQNRLFSLISSWRNVFRVGISLFLVFNCLFQTLNWSSVSSNLESVERYKFNEYKLVSLLLVFCEPSTE